MTTNRNTKRVENAQEKVFFLALMTLTVGCAGAPQRPSMYQFSREDRKSMVNTELSRCQWLLQSKLGSNYTDSMVMRCMEGSEASTQTMIEREQASLKREREAKTPITYQSKNGEERVYSMQSTSKAELMRRAAEYQMYTEDCEGTHGIKPEDDEWCLKYATEE